MCIRDRCYSLASVTLPEGLESIGKNAFYQCYSLASVTLPESLKSIGKGAFSQCLSCLLYTSASTQVSKALAAVRGETEGNA